MAALPSPAAIRYQLLHIADDSTPSLTAANVICFTIAFVSVALRFLARRVARVKYAADDWLILIGLCFMAGGVGLSFSSYQYGGGRHTILLTDPAAYTKLVLAGEVIWGPTTTAVKLSILCLYHRIFFVSRSFRWTLWAVGTFIVSYCLVQTFASILACIPIESFWTVGIPHYCVNIRAASTTIPALNVLSDFVILILPITLLYKMKMPLKQKIEIIGIFLLGGIVLFASIYRTVVTYRIDFKDPSWGYTPAAVCTIAELGVGILGACLPTIRPLFRRRKGSKMGYSGSEQKQGKSTGGTSDQTLRDASGSGSVQGQEKGSFGIRSNSSLTFIQPSPDRNKSESAVTPDNVEQRAESCV